MENSLKLKKWILASAQKGLLQISKVTWPHDFNLHIHDYVVEIEYEDSKIIGQGSSLDADTAICKATSEAFERYVVAKRGIDNSNGCSAHFKLAEAKEKAKLELLERDSFLFKYIKNENFCRIDQHEINIKLPQTSKLTNYLLPSNKSNFLILTRIEVNGISNIFGLGSGRSLENAIFSGEVEALRQWSHIFHFGKREIRRYSDIFSQEKFTFDDHGDLALTKEHHDAIEHLFSKNINQDTYTEPKGEFSFQTHFSENEVKSPFFEVPLFFARCSNKNVQNLFTGPTEKALNPNRITERNGLNLCFHPLR